MSPDSDGLGRRLTEGQQRLAQICIILIGDLDPQRFAHDLQIGAATGAEPVAQGIDPASMLAPAGIVRLQ